MREVVPNTQAIAMVTLFVVGNTLVFALGGVAGPDIWLAFLVAMVLASPMLLLFARLSTLLHGEALGSALTRLYGKWPSRVIAFGYSFYAWRLGCFVVGDVTSFIQSSSLPKTPQIVLAIGFALLVLWAVKGGVEVIARWSVVMAKIVLAVLFATFLLLWTEVRLEEFLPVMYDGAMPVLRGALQLLDFPFLELVLIVWAMDRYTKENSPYKVILPGFLLGAFILLLLTSTSLAVLGSHRYPVYYFPVYTAVARIDVAAFLTRLEAIVGVTFAVGSFLKMSVCLLTASKTLAHGLGFEDYRFLVTPLVLSIIPASQWFGKTTMDIEGSATKFVSATAVIYQVILPIIMWIIAEVRSRKTAKTSG